MVVFHKIQPYDPRWAPYLSESRSEWAAWVSSHCRVRSRFARCIFSARWRPSSASPTAFLQKTSKVSGNIREYSGSKEWECCLIRKSCGESGMLANVKRCNQYCSEGVVLTDAHQSTRLQINCCGPDLWQHLTRFTVITADQEHRESPVVKAFCVFVVT